MKRLEALMTGDVAASAHQGSDGSDGLSRRCPPSSTGGEGQTGWKCSLSGPARVPSKHFFPKSTIFGVDDGI
jgi:hypothetical protein